MVTDTAWQDPEPDAPTGVEATRRRSAELFAVLGDVDAPRSERDGARDALVHLHLPLVEHLATTWASVDELCAGLTDAEWATPTGCPGWTVQDQVAHLERIGIAQVQRRKLLAALQLQHGEVRARVAQNDLRLELALVGEGHLHVRHPHDDVLVGDDEAGRHS